MMSYVLIMYSSHYVSQVHNVVSQWTDYICNTLVVAIHWLIATAMMLQCWCIRSTQAIDVVVFAVSVCVCYQLLAANVVAQDPACKGEVTQIFMWCSAICSFSTTDRMYLAQEAGKQPYNVELPDLTTYTLSCGLCIYWQRSSTHWVSSSPLLRVT